MESKDIAKERNQTGVDWVLIRNARNKTKPVPTQGKGSFSDALPEVAKVLQRLANEKTGATNGGSQMKTADIQKEMLSPYEIRCNLEREIQQLKHDLVLKDAAIKVLMAKNAELRQHMGIVVEAQATLNHPGPNPFEAMQELARRMKPVVAAMRKAKLI